MSSAPVVMGTASDLGLPGGVKDTGGGAEGHSASAGSGLVGTGAGGGAGG